MMMYKKNDMREKERERERTFLHRPNQSLKQASWPASSLSDLGLMNILSLFSLLSVPLFCLCLNDPNKASSWQQEFVILCHKRSSYPASCEDHPMHGDDSGDEPIYFHEICMGQREALAQLKSKLRVLCFALLSTLLILLCFVFYPVERIWSFISPTLKSSKWVLFFLGLGGDH
jgi:hypothetical protein